MQFIVNAASHEFHLCKFNIHWGMAVCTRFTLFNHINTGIISKFRKFTAFYHYSAKIKTEFLAKSCSPLNKIKDYWKY